MGQKLLHLSLDALAQDGYIYSDYDVRGAGHDLYVPVEDRQKFLDEYAAKFRAQVERLLEDYEEED